MYKYIIISIGKGYGRYPIDKNDCGLKKDLTFDPDITLAKTFKSKEEAVLQLQELYEYRKSRGFSGKFFIREIICF